MVSFHRFKKKITLDDAVKRLQDGYNENLVAVILYGSAATADYVEGYSDHNLLAVVKESAIPDLRRDAWVVDWVRQGNPSPVFFTERQIMDSLDTFPVEFLDMKDSRKLLFGKDVLAGAAVDTKHLRHQIEHDLRSKCLALRSAYVADARRKGDLSRLMVESSSSFMVLFRHLLRLFGDTPPADKAAVLTALVKRAGFNRAVFEEVLTARARKVKVLPDEDLLFAKYVGSVESIIEAVDKL